MARNSRSQRQTTLIFSPLAPSDPARHSQPEAIRNRAAAVGLSASPSPRRNGRTMNATMSLPTPRKSSQNDSLLGSSPLRMQSKKRSTFMASGNLTQTPERKKSQTSTFPPIEDSDSEVSIDRISSDQNLAMPSGSSRKRPLSLEDSEDDELVVQPSRKVHKSKPQPQSDSELELLENSSTSNPKQQQSDSDSDVLVTQRFRRLRRGKPVQLSPSDTDELPVDTKYTSEQPVDDEDDVDDGPLSNRRGTSSKTRRTNAVPRKSSKPQDLEDLEEDLEFLRSSPPSTIRRTAKNKQQVKQKALEALRRRRKQLSKNNLSSADEDSDTEDVAAISDDDFNPQEMDMDRNVDDFVVTDDEDGGVIGAPVELPFAFSRYQTMKAQELFKFAVEWMVQKKINPAFAMTDDVYRISFQRLDDFVRGMGGSKFTSSAWTSEFLRSLQSCPNMENNRFINSGLLHGRCDACNRSGHPATWEVRFMGNTYDIETLEEDDSDDDSDDEENPNEGLHKMYYIGKFCMQNARTAHTLKHWRYHLNQWVVDYLKGEGYLTAEKIVERDSWSVRKRRKYANKITDRMEEGEEIKRLYRDFRHETSTAQLANDNY